MGGGASISGEGGQKWFASGSSKTEAGGDTVLSSGSDNCLEVPCQSSAAQVSTWEYH